LNSALRAFTANATSEVDVFGHNCDALGVDSAQVCVLEQANQVSLSGLLKRHNCSALEAEIGLEILGDFTNKTLEGKLEGGLAESKLKEHRETLTLRSKSSVDFWNLRISRSATVPGRNL
jgi:hypothetical protein